MSRDDRDDAARYWGALALVVEGGWTRKSEGVVMTVGLPEVQRTNNFFHVGAGPRVARHAGRVRPYAQVLIGASRRHYHLNEYYRSYAGFMVQPGGGATFVMGGWGLFADVAYRRSFFGVIPRDERGVDYLDGNSNEARVLVDARIIFD